MYGKTRKVEMDINYLPGGGSTIDPRVIEWFEQAAADMEPTPAPPRKLSDV